MKKISIIVPVYNVGKHIEYCVSSVLNQSYPNFELILVNDGSSDNSGDLCNMFPHKDHRIKVYHQENAGVSAARNLGIRNSTGDYIMFIDGDDWIEPNALELLVKRIEETNVDICYCNKYFKDKSKIYSSTDVNTTDATDIKTAISYHLKNKFISSPCFSLARNTQKCYFDETIHCMEDWEYNLRLLLSLKTFTILNLPYYHYRTTENSASTSKLNKKKLSCFLIPQKIEKYANNQEYRISKKQINCISISLAYMLLTILSSNGYTSIEDIIFIKNECQKLLFFAWSSKNVSINKKLSITLGALSPQLYSFFFKLKYGK